MSNEKQQIDILKTELIFVYLNELLYLCEGIRRECEQIFEEANVPEKGHSIQIAPVLHSRINSVLIYAANIKKLITTKEHKDKKESRRKFQLRQQ